MYAFILYIFITIHNYKRNIILPFFYALNIKRANSRYDYFSYTLKGRKRAKKGEIINSVSIILFISEAKYVKIE